MNLKQLLSIFLVFMFVVCVVTAFNINKVSKIYNTADVFVTLKAGDGTTMLDTVNASSDEFLLLGDNMVFEVVDGGIRVKDGGFYGTLSELRERVLRTTNCIFHLGLCDEWIPEFFGFKKNNK